MRNKWRGRFHNAVLSDVADTARVMRRGGGGGGRFWAVAAGAPPGLGHEYGPGWAYLSFRRGAFCRSIPAVWAGPLLGPTAEDRVGTFAAA